MHKYIHIYIYICTCIYIYIYTHIYVYLYTRIVYIIYDYTCLVWVYDRGVELLIHIPTPTRIPTPIIARMLILSLPILLVIAGVEQYVFNEEMAKKLKDSNPEAFRNVVGRFLEATARFIKNQNKAHTIYNNALLLNNTTTNK